jgi:hypothetical protein
VIVSQKVENIILSPSIVISSRLFVILSPSPTVILSRAKDLGFRLRVDSAKDLIACLRHEILRLRSE